MVTHRMQRRTLLRRIGAASVATTAASGQAAATPVIELDRTIDVSDVSGRVPLDRVLTDREASRVSWQVDGATELVVPADRAVLADCINCCDGEDNGCGSCIPDCDTTSPIASSR